MGTKKMWLILIIPFIWSCRTNRISQDLCKKAHTGQFIRKLQNPTGMGHWTFALVYIDRSDNKEIGEMYYPMRNMKVYQIEWISECEYNRKIVDLNDWADTVIAKMYPDGQKVRIKEITAVYILEKPFRGKTDTLWFRK